MSWQTYDAGRLVEQGDDATRTVTTYGEGGQVMSTRPYTASENAAADAAAADEAEREARRVDRQAIRDLFTRLDATLIEATGVRTDIATALAATAPTNVAQMWKAHKDGLVLDRRTIGVAIDLARDVKAIAKVLREDQ